MEFLVVKISKQIILTNKLKIYSGIVNRTNHLTKVWEVFLVRTRHPLDKIKSIRIKVQVYLVRILIHLIMVIN